MKDIIIIGAGPTGLYTAYKLAKKGFNVNCYEEHKVIGKPLQCAGIVSSELSKVIELEKKFVVNKLSKVKVISKHKTAVLDINDIVIDRVKFDKYIAKLAEKQGVKINLGYKYLGIDKENIVLADKKNKFVKVHADKLIGADGGFSDVGASNKMLGKRKFYVGVQARVKGKFDADTYEVWLGSICPGFFAWVIPESKTIARIGIAVKTKASEAFSKFLEVKGVKKKDIIDKQGGLIPIYNPKQKVQKNDVYLVGDAAGQVKASTGGGLVPGLKAAKILADCIVNNKSYEKGLARVKRELNMHLRIRGLLDKFSNKDYDQLIKTLSKPKIKKILRQTNRDSSSELVVKLVLAEPRLLWLGIKSFKMLNYIAGVINNVRDSWF